MKVSRAGMIVWAERLGPVTALVVFRLVRELILRGTAHTDWVGDALIIVGWMVGLVLAEGDGLLYALTCNPQELTCQRVKKMITDKRWAEAWSLLESTKEERVRLPIKNILTAFAVTGAGLWIATSSHSSLGAGVALGLSYKLWLEIYREQNFEKWYWVFARKFTLQEHKGLITAWAIAWGLQVLILAGR